jgi:hypothetical protein
MELAALSAVNEMQEIELEFFRGVLVGVGRMKVTQSKLLNTMAAVSIAALLVSNSAFSKGAGTGAAAAAGSGGAGVGVGVGAGVGGVGVGVSASAGNNGVGATANATAGNASASAGVGVSSANGVGASASATTGVGVSASVGVSAPGVGVSAPGVGVSADSAGVSPAAPLGITAVDIQGRLTGNEGKAWRALLKRRCPAITARPNQYSADLVDLCRFVAMSALRRAHQSHIEISSGPVRQRPVSSETGSSGKPVTAQ